MIIKGKRISAGRYLLMIVFIQLFSPLYALKAEDNNAEKLVQLKKRVGEILNKDNVSMRSEIADVYRLADIYANKGRDSAALDLYMKALQVDSWNLYYQLKTAELLAKNYRRTEAVEKAEIVFEYSEDEKLINASYEFLSDIGYKFPPKKKNQADSDIHIVIVPLGKVNMAVVEETAAELESKMGIRYTIEKAIPEIGRPGRTYAEKYIDVLIERFKRRMDRKVFEEIEIQTAIGDFEEADYTSKKNFVAKCLSKSGISIAEFAEFRDSLQEAEKDGQYNTSNLNTILEGKFKINRNRQIYGYLGITECDIYTGDKNFLFGWAGQGYGVMSYHRFMSNFYSQPPNRPRLIKRAVKQAVSSSFYILGIGRCSSPLCARAYPHSLDEHDSKGSEICSICKGRLISKIEQAKKRR